MSYNNLSANRDIKVNRNTTQLPDVVRTLRNIVNTLGGIDVETLIPEYEVSSVTFNDLISF